MDLIASVYPVQTLDGRALGVGVVVVDVTRRNARQQRTERDLTAHIREQAGVLERLQTAILPPSLPKHPSFDIDARYESAAEVVEIGGDWYDAFEAPDGRLLVTVGDAVGHGVPAIEVMALARTALRAFIAEGHGPASALEALHTLMRREDAMATCTVVAIAPDHRIEYASAGHPWPYVRHRSGATRPLDLARGVPLGSLAGRQLLGRPRCAGAVRRPRALHRRARRAPGRTARRRVRSASGGPGRRGPDERRGPGRGAARALPRGPRPLRRRVRADPGRRGRAGRCGRGAPVGPGVSLTDPGGDARGDPDPVDPPAVASVGAVVFYWRPGCGFCSSLRRRLGRAGVALDERNIWEDEEAAAAVRGAARGSETVPTVRVGDRWLVNPSSRQVLAALGVEPPPGRVRAWLRRRRR